MGEAGALGFTASNDDILYVIIWLTVFAAVFPAAVTVLSPDYSQTEVAAGKGPHDRYRPSYHDILSASGVI